MSSALASMDGCSCLTCDIQLPLAKNTLCPNASCNTLVDSGRKVRRNPDGRSYLGKEQSPNQEPLTAEGAEIEICRVRRKALLRDLCVPLRSLRLRALGSSQLRIAGYPRQPAGPTIARR